MYSKINRLLGKGDKILPDTHDDKELAENFKTFFTEKIQKIRNDIEKEQEVEGNNSGVPYCESEFSDFCEISKAELWNFVKGLPNKNCMLDVIPNWLLKECFDELSPILLYIINGSLVEGVFPQPLKHAIVSPALKSNKDDPDNLKCFRPISNLSTVSKLLEKVVSVQLNNYLNGHSLYCDEQSGYRKAHSCETLLLKFQDDIINRL